MSRPLFFLIILLTFLLAACQPSAPISVEPQPPASEAPVTQPPAGENPPVSAPVDLPLTTSAPAIDLPLAPASPKPSFPTKVPLDPAFTRSSPSFVPSPVGDPFRTPAFDLARRDLSKRLGISPEQVGFISAEEVTWRDASLGCPQPGMFYAQVLSPGYRLRLSYEGKVFTYHTDLGGFAVWCEKGEEPLPDLPVVPGQIDDGKPWIPVD